MIAHTMVNLVIKEGPQSVPSGFGTVEQIFPSVFNEKFITVISRANVKTESEAIAHRIFYVVERFTKPPRNTAQFISRVTMLDDHEYNIYAEPKQKELS